MALSPHQERMLVERDELCKKVLDLFNFMKSEQFQTIDHDEASLLRMQYAAMMQYQVILHMRISKFVN